MSKDRTSVSVDEEVAQYLRQESVNASGLVNRLVKNEMNGFRSDRQLVELRLDQATSELEDLRTRVKQKEREVARLEEKLEQFNDDREEKLAEAREHFRPDQLTEDNPAVENWSEKLDMTPAEFIEAVQQ